MSNSVDDYTKGWHVYGLPTGSICGAYVDWRGKCTCHVDRVSRVECTSIQITVTLRYE
jgi:hypothetical protein